MKFYRENDINPFASCLPLVAQLPVFIALYYVLRAFSEEAQGGTDLSFMWIISDVSVDFQELGWWSVVPLLVIYGLTQLLSTELSATPNMPESQRRMMRFLPIVIVIFVVNFPVPAGLVLYWMATNLWTCGQQLVMRHRIGLHLAEVPESATTGKRSSRTAPKTATALVSETEATEDAAEARDEEAGIEAPEATEAPEAPEAPQPATAEERPAPAATGRGASGGGKRRQPRPSGAGGPSRPAQRRSSSKKKKR
jgi:YidC/Oxa1 family membrane protein insertase